ncbi:MAG: Hsp20/alpha crystallin family protein [Oligoflexales bacterium]|nr:Hsp20/alpha crystallin family protein [Oligoflexales bacterium]
MRALSLLSLPEIFDFPFNTVFGSLESVEKTFQPEWGLEENDRFVKLSVDLPGVKKEDINIETKDGRLVISGERKSEKKDDGKSGSYYFRSYGKFRKEFTLDRVYNPEAIEASYNNGVLEIAIPKAEEVKSKRIEIGNEPLKMLKN